MVEGHVKFVRKNVSTRQQALLGVQGTLLTACRTLCVCVCCTLIDVLIAGVGAIIGELSLLLGSAPMSSAVAVDDVLAYTIDAATLREVIHYYIVF